MTTAAVIVAAGKGLRAGGGVPKQWRDLAGRSVAAWTLHAFRNHPAIDQIVLVLSADDMGLAPGYEGHPDVIVVAGAETRDGSVRAGLEALTTSPPEKVLIHDVARPLISQKLITRVVDALDNAEGAAPALAVTDALWRGKDGQVAGTQDRTDLFRAQTPQGFSFAKILNAHRNNSQQAADDVEVARAAGLKVVIVDGEERNLKITTAADFQRAEQLMKGDMDIRLGNGFDVHRFGPGDSVVLCGVTVPHDRALQGHSDADVGMHALTDAIYGALAEGDIGRHFPPSEAKWKGADSRIFLEHAMSRVTERGFKLGNADVTLICERPKIGPHAEQMAACLAQIMSVEASRISVKATTSEKLGFTGREEGIAAMATATLVTK